MRVFDKRGTARLSSDRRSEVVKAWRSYTGAMVGRRKALLTFGALVSGVGAAFGTGAFSSVQAGRDVEVEVADDAAALLGIETGEEGAEYVNENGAIEVDISSTNSGGQGVNPNAVTAVDQLLEVTNNGTEEEEVAVGFRDEYAIDEGDYDEGEVPGGWGYVVNQNENAAAVVWASPLPEDMDKSLEQVRPDLVSTGFTGSTLVDGRIDSEVEDKEDRTVGTGESINIGIVVDTRESTVEENPLPDGIDNTVTLTAERT